MFQRSSIAALAAVALVLAGTTACKPLPKPANGVMRDLGTLGGEPSGALFINDHGVVAGTSVNAHPQQYDTYNVFLWSQGEMHDLGAEYVEGLNERNQVAVNNCGGHFCGGGFSSLDGPIELGPGPGCGGQGSWSLALNDRSEFLLQCFVPDPPPASPGSNSLRSFLWSDGQWLDVGPPGSHRAAALNNAGQVVGQGYAGNAWYAYLWSDGRTTDLGTLGGPSSGATAINERGQVVGTSDTAVGTSHAFLWSRGSMHDLGTLGGPNSTPVAVNVRGQVAGTSDMADGTKHAFLWSGGSMHDLGTLGGPSSTAAAINARGQVVGTSDLADGTHHAFLWQRGRMYDLGTLGGVNSSAADINVRGQVVGESDTTEGGGHAFLWSAGEIGVG